MSNKLDDYKLSVAADIDLDEIFDYTENQHNYHQAVKYLNCIETVFQSFQAHI